MVEGLLAQAQKRVMAVGERLRACSFWAVTQEGPKLSKEETLTVQAALKVLVEEA